MNARMRVASCRVDDSLGFRLDARVGAWVGSWVGRRRIAAKANLDGRAVSSALVTAFLKQRSMLVRNSTAGRQSGLQKCETWTNNLAIATRTPPQKPQNCTRLPVQVERP